MTRIEAMAAWFFTSLGIALLAASIVVVPADAFADGGGDCASACSSQCGSDEECFNICVGQCCAASCSGEGACQQECCEIACDFDGDCWNVCMMQSKMCAGVFKCLPSCTTLPGSPPRCSNVKALCSYIPNPFDEEKCKDCRCLCGKIDTINNSCLSCQCQN